MTANQNYIGMEHAKAIILHETRTLSSDAVFTDCALEHDANGALYHIMFGANAMEYETYVDAVTGEVLGLFSEPQEEASLCEQVCA